VPGGAGEHVLQGGKKPTPDLELLLMREGPLGKGETGTKIHHPGIRHVPPQEATTSGPRAFERAQGDERKMYVRRKNFRLLALEAKQVSSKKGRKNAQ